MRVGVCATSLSGAGHAKEAGVPSPASGNLKPQLSGAEHDVRDVPLPQYTVKPSASLSGADGLAVCPLGSFSRMPFWVVKRVGNCSRLY